MFIAGSCTIIRYDCESAAAFLLNIPSRFDFEVALHEARENGTISSPEDLSEMMVSAWTGRYGDALQAEMDPMFWASKLHFYMTSPQFYNFPYTFGYLFALGVYAQSENAGESFHAQYVALLRDTGRMTAEELVQHFYVPFFRCDVQRCFPYCCDCLRISPISDQQHSDYIHALVQRGPVQWCVS